MLRTGSKIQSNRIIFNILAIGNENIKPSFPFQHIQINYRIESDLQVRRSEKHTKYGSDDIEIINTQIIDPKVYDNNLNFWDNIIKKSTFNHIDNDSIHIGLCGCNCLSGEIFINDSFDKEWVLQFYNCGGLKFETIINNKKYAIELNRSELKMVKLRLQKINKIVMNSIENRINKELK